MTRPGFSRQSVGLGNGMQIVAIISVDVTTGIATGMTRQGASLQINTKLHTGAIQSTPAVGEQWLVQMLPTSNAWSLFNKLPTNSPSATIPAAAGQTHVGSSGTLQLHGSTIQANAPLSPSIVNAATRPTANTVPPGSMVYDLSIGQNVYSDGRVWRNAAGHVVEPNSDATLSAQVGGVADGLSGLRSSQLGGLHANIVTKASGRVTVGSGGDKGRSAELYVSVIPSAMAYVQPFSFSDVTDAIGMLTISVIHWWMNPRGYTAKIGEPPSIGFKLIPLAPSQSTAVPAPPTDNFLTALFPALKENEQELANVILLPYGVTPDTDPSYEQDYPPPAGYSSDGTASPDQAANARPWVWAETITNWQGMRYAFKHLISMISDEIYDLLHGGLTSVYPLGQSWPLELWQDVLLIGHNTLALFGIVAPKDTVDPTIADYVLQETGEPISPENEPTPIIYLFASLQQFFWDVTGDQGTTHVSPILLDYSKLATDLRNVFDDFASIFGFKVPPGRSFDALGPDLAQLWRDWTQLEGLEYGAGLLPWLPLIWAAQGYISSFLVSLKLVLPPPQIRRVYKSSGSGFSDAQAGTYYYTVQAYIEIDPPTESTGAGAFIGYTTPELDGNGNLVDFPIEVEAGNFVQVEITEVPQASGYMLLRGSSHGGENVIAYMGTNAEIDDAGYSTVITDASGNQSKIITLPDNNTSSVPAVIQRFNTAVYGILGQGLENIAATVEETLQGVNDVTRLFDGIGAWLMHPGPETAAAINEDFATLASDIKADFTPRPGVAIFPDLLPIFGINWRGIGTEILQVLEDLLFIGGRGWESLPVDIKALFDSLVNGDSGLQLGQPIVPLIPEVFNDVMADLGIVVPSPEVTSTSRAFGIAGAVPPGTYTYYVLTYTSRGPDYPSSIGPPAPHDPGRALQTVTVPAGGDWAVNISWDYQLLITQPRAVRGFLVVRVSQDGTTVLLSDQPANSSSFVDRGVGGTSFMFPTWNGAYSSTFELISDVVSLVTVDIFGLFIAFGTWLAAPTAFNIASVHKAVGKFSEDFANVFQTELPGNFNLPSAIPADMTWLNKGLELLKVTVASPAQDTLEASAFGFGGTLASGNYTYWVGSYTSYSEQAATQDGGHMPYISVPLASYPVTIQVAPGAAGGYVKFSWGQAVGADGYVVLRSRDDDPTNAYYLVGTVPLSATATAGDPGPNSTITDYGPGRNAQAPYPVPDVNIAARGSYEYVLEAFTALVIGLPDLVTNLLAIFNLAKPVFPPGSPSQTGMPSTALAATVNYIISTIVPDAPTVSVLAGPIGWGSVGGDLENVFNDIVSFFNGGDRLLGGHLTALVHHLTGDASYTPNISASVADWGKVGPDLEAIFNDVITLFDQGWRHLGEDVQTLIRDLIGVDYVPQIAAATTNWGNVGPSLENVLHDVLHFYDGGASTLNNHLQTLIQDLTGILHWPNLPTSRTNWLQVPADLVFLLQCITFQNGYGWHDVPRALEDLTADLTGHPSAGMLSPAASIPVKVMGWGDVPGGLSSLATGLNNFLWQGVVGIESDIRYLTQAITGTSVSSHVSGPGVDWNALPTDFYNLIQAVVDLEPWSSIAYQIDTLCINLIGINPGFYHPASFIEAREVTRSTAAGVGLLARARSTESSALRPGINRCPSSLHDLSRATTGVDVYDGGLKLSAPGWYSCTVSVQINDENSVYALEPLLLDDANEVVVQGPTYLNSVNIPELHPVAQCHGMFEVTDPEVVYYAGYSLHLHSGDAPRFSDRESAACHLSVFRIR